MRLLIEEINKCCECPSYQMEDEETGAMLSCRLLWESEELQEKFREFHEKNWRIWVDYEKAQKATEDQLIFPECPLPKVTENPEE